MWGSSVYCWDILLQNVQILWNHKIRSWQVKLFVHMNNAGYCVDVIFMPMSRSLNSVSNLFTKAYFCIEDNCSFLLVIWWKNHFFCSCVETLNFACIDIKKKEEKILIPGILCNGSKKFYLYCLFFISMLILCLSIFIFIGM